LIRFSICTEAGFITNRPFQNDVRPGFALSASTRYRSQALTRSSVTTAEPDSGEFQKEKSQPWLRREVANGLVAALVEVDATIIAARFVNPASRAGNIDFLKRRVL
jgi:hypothetical protein